MIARKKNLFSNSCSVFAQVPRLQKKNLRENLLQHENEFDKSVPESLSGEKTESTDSLFWHAQDFIAQIMLMEAVELSHTIIKQWLLHSIRLDPHSNT